MSVFGASQVKWRPSWCGLRGEATEGMAALIFLCFRHRRRLSASLGLVREQAFCFATAPRPGVISIVDPLECGRVFFAGSKGGARLGQYSWPFRLVRVDEDRHGNRQGLLRPCRGLGHAGFLGAPLDL